MTYETTPYKPRNVMNQYTKFLHPFDVKRLSSLNACFMAILFVYGWGKPDGLFSAATSFGNTATPAAPTTIDKKFLRFMRDSEVLKF